MLFDFLGTLRGFPNPPALAPAGGARLRSGYPLAMALTIGALAVAGGCSSKTKSFVVLKLESGTQIVSITRVVVDVSQGSMSNKLTYYPDPAVTLDATHSTDLSVNFSGGQSGAVAFHVALFNQFQCQIGEGTTTGIIKGGNVAQVNVAISFLGDCSQHDGGADASGDTFPGCDPVAANCAAGKTCQVNCDKHVGECTAGGTGLAGATCAKNADCAPGLQCFDYSATGCNVKVCLRFCNQDDGCVAATDGGLPDGAATGAAAVGTRSVCQGPVQCAGAVTGYRTCTFGCDPRETAATDKTTGCPPGLSCLVVGDMDQVDCACAEATRSGKDNAPCTSSAQCAPGYICNLMSGARVCRALCRCDAKGMTCSARNDCAPASGKTCAALTNDTTFGVCL
jgi:hypothetical protein